MKKLKHRALLSESAKYVVKRNPVSVGIGLLITLVALIYLGSSVFKSRNQSQQEGGFAMSVEAHKVAVQPLDDKIVTVGSVKANESVIIRSELPGLIREILFQEGTPVKRGNVLVILN